MENNKNNVQRVDPLNYKSAAYRPQLLDPINATIAQNVASGPVEYNPFREPPLVSPTPDINDVLKERGSRYGSFNSHAHLTQNLKRVMQSSARWTECSADKKEALEMIAHKIGRILNGDPNYDDSWADIAGYAQLVVNNLRGI
jgi:hypothetical protein